MKKKLILVLSLVVLSIFSGCLEYERQTMSFRYDVGSDTLLIFQDYQGIFGAHDSAQLSADEAEQMASVMAGGRTFFFNNWITEFNRARLLEMTSKPAGELDEDPAYEAAMRAVIETALANVKVENVGFYYDAQHRLCGAQRITVRHASQLLAALNDVLRFVAREEAGKDEKSAEEKRNLLRFAASDQKVLSLDGNRLEMRWALTEADYRECKDVSRVGREFQGAGGEMRYADGVIVLALGRRDAPWTTLTLPFSEKAYVNNAVAEAKKYGIQESFDAEAAARAFLDRK